MFFAIVSPIALASKVTSRVDDPNHARETKGNQHSYK